ncbi:MBL fold metallo-hydrolase [Alicyclobacillus mengziensis]|uniref:MBL fold metallo-hydrolase n=1 Tax=Alicyclobacillus mengziensis TaxID=2931921 RepID=A0A9X7VZV4_9BACL|nr:MBL fold metallo-hydrolase [Alicyclobacillus mengziensis]QSO48086.1 MBL fold metallo-hydrolase [Alicyclobacillus mengziensis]
MRVHVLGHWGAYPEPGQATTGLLVETDKQRVLIDAGSGVLSQLFDICTVSDLTAVVITHHHHDHTADLGVLGYALLLSRITGSRTTKLPIYMLPGSEERMSEWAREPLADVHVLSPDSKVDIDGIQVSFAATVHAVPCLAVRMEYQGETFVFSADTSYCQPVTKLARSADLFLCESSMYLGQERDARAAGHVTAPEAGQMASAAGVKRLVLTHLPHYGNLDDLVLQAATTYNGPILRAEHRMVLEVSSS